MGYGETAKGQASGIHRRTRKRRPEPVALADQDGPRRDAAALYQRRRMTSPGRSPRSPGAAMTAPAQARARRTIGRHADSEHVGNGRDRPPDLNRARGWLASLTAPHGGEPAVLIPHPTTSCQSATRPSIGFDESHGKQAAVAAPVIATPRPWARVEPSWTGRVPRCPSEAPVAAQGAGTQRQRRKQQGQQQQRHHP